MRIVAVYITVYITATTAGSSFRHVFCCRLRLGMLRIGAFLSMFREGMRPRLVFDIELLDRMIADENQIATASSLGNLVKRFKKITQNRALNLVNMSNVAKGESQTT